MMTKTFSPLESILTNKTGQRQFWKHLHGAASSLAILSAAISHNGIIVVITADTQAANKLFEELNFFNNDNQAFEILIFPDWEILPYDHFSPHQDIISERLLTLYKLPQLTKGIVLVPVNTLMHYISAKQYVESLTFVLQKGGKLELTDFQRRLSACGYHHVSQVMEHGEFSIRGSLIDLFPMGSQKPYRIDLFDNEIDSIRLFEPETQRSSIQLDEIRLFPAKEYPLSEESITHFRQKWRHKFTGNPIHSPLYETITRGQFAAGTEYYLSLFFEKPGTLFDYFKQNSLIIQTGNIEEKATLFWQEVADRYEQLRYNIERPILEPKDIVLQVNELFSQMKNFQQVTILSEADKQSSTAIDYRSLPPVDLKIESRSQRPLVAVENYLRDSAHRVLFCAETLGRRESLLSLLNNAQISPTPVGSWKAFIDSSISVGITVGGLDTGLTIVDPNITILTESELFGKQVMQRRLRTKSIQDPEAIIRDLSELNVGAPVVHLYHGVGKYLGLQVIKSADFEAEFLTLEYAAGDKLYVPISALHLIARYTGRDDEHAPIYQLGTKKWEKIKQKAAEKVRDVAAELLDVYAKREAKVGFSFSKPQHYYLQFTAEFPFEETPDQFKAIEDVIQDMTSIKPMDRLICGDVGFGKTEVAMRAAFIAIQDNKQVIVLVPTTLLAEQHYQNFKDRFANWPIKIASLSRFQAKKEQTTIIQEIKDGKIDIIIGTHKLLQPDVHFKNLGLLIIDEEHRFGVQQKEKLKALKSEVDILTLTATPIPRTLNMSLSGVRDLSIIATPPAKRLSIKTFVREYQPSIIREAILREILRGGQAYFLHNDVKTISQTCDLISELIPEAKVNFAHGQMTERSLEKVMSDFYHARFNVLVATTIIESGIDIPTANTMIINKANHFGLAQLHQLRGRVGRSHHQAYAYLLTPPPKMITKDALKRLEAIESLEDLGAGFMLATHDLEIRGAGEILGEEQSGFIHEVGFHLYTEMLNHAVSALKQGKDPSMDEPIKGGTEVELKITALIPEDYLPDIHIRLTFYKRIASAKNSDDLEDIQVEMIDRFGLLPTQIKNLFSLAELKLAAESLGIRKIEWGSGNARIDFDVQPKIDLTNLLNLVQKQPNLYQLEGACALKIKMSHTQADEKIKLMTQLIRILAPSDIPSR